VLASRLAGSRQRFEKKPRLTRDYELAVRARKRRVLATLVLV